jgi:hypothetical protein
MCRECIRRRHERLPWHRIKEWTGLFFKDAALWQTGSKIYLGHDGAKCNFGGKCTNARPSEDPAASKEPAASDRPAHEPQQHEYRAWAEEFPLDDIDDDDFEEISEAVNVPICHPRLLPRPPNTDAMGNQFLTVIDTTGIHHMPFVHCFCNGRKDVDILLMELGLFPASFKDVETVFTFEVLDDFRIENLECKVSAWQYFNKLRRITCPFFPTSVANRYAELRRASRAWRNLKLYQEHGFGHHTTKPGIGGMAYFCAACPQPGVNLPDNWKENQNSDLYIRSFVHDGNFKAEHVAQKRPQDDVHLTNGELYMTAPEPYKQHLAKAVELAPKLAIKGVRRSRYLAWARRNSRLPCGQPSELFGAVTPPESPLNKY